MLCQECNSNEATLLINTTINGVKSTQYLCQKCAAKYGIGNFMSAGDVLASMFSGMGNPAAFQPHEKTCTECGYTLSQFRRNSLLGCDKCYESFREELMPMIKRIHGNTIHKPEAGEQPKQDSLTKLKTELQDAITKEEYERAAQIRDMIKDLENKAKPEAK